jgi:hypothetical protein
VTTEVQVATARSLAQNEEIITRGQRTFIEVGNALMEIREQRQYKDAGYTDFDTYCRERWGWSKRHANRIVETAEVVLQLGPIGPAPQTEGQARPLAPLRSDPPAMREAWQDAQRIAAEREKPVTQAIVQEAVDARRDQLMQRADENREAAAALAEMVDLVPIAQWVSHHTQISQSLDRHMELPATNAYPDERQRSELAAASARYSVTAEVINSYLKGTR